MQCVEQIFVSGDDERRMSGALPGNRPDSAPGRDVPAVMIIEDDFFIAAHLEALLDTLEIKCSGIAGNPETAIALAAGIKGNLLLLADVNLGHHRIDGIETARTICGGRAAEVIFVTAYSDTATLTRIRRAFPDAIVLHKPVALTQLADAIERALRTEN